jgi:alanine-synthesizing transaminase
MFVWARIPEEWLARMDTMQFAMRLLEEADVAVSPGSGFGPAGEGYLRMALVENDRRLRQAVRQIGRFVRGETRCERPSAPPRPEAVAGAVEVDVAG